MGTITWPADFRPTWIDGLRAWGVGADSVGIPLIQEVRLEPPEVLRD
jgi:hypothetical protein